MKDHGIRVCAVLPGDAATGFTDAREKGGAGDAVYPHAQSAVEAMERDERNGMSPEQVARVIVKAAVCRSPRPLYTVGSKYRVLMVLYKLLPARLAYYLVGKLYA